MTNKLIFLNDESIYSQRLMALLRTRGYSLILPETKEQLGLVIRQDEASLLLHVTGNASKFLSFCQQVESINSDFPILHIMAEPLLTAYPWLSGPFQEWLSPQSSDELILRRIENMIYCSGLQRELQEMKELQEKTDGFLARIRSLDAQVVINEAMDLFMQDFKCDNILWFPLGSLESELKKHLETQNLLSPPVRPNSAALWQAQRALPEGQVSTIFKNWCPLSLLGGDFLESIQELSGVEGCGDVILPVAGGPRDRVFGHFVLVNPHCWNQKKGRKIFFHYLMILANQLDQAVTYSDVQSLTYKDDLTDLYNQRYLPLILDQELKRSARAQTEFSVLFLDVDFFKIVNDTKGHMVGSKVLVELSKLFKQSIRSTDFAFRYGGDEYVIVLSRANSENARQVAERLRKRTEESTFLINGEPVKITVSIGIATFPEHAHSTEELLNLADEAMYFGKHKSRNVVYLAS